MSHQDHHSDEFDLKRKCILVVTKISSRPLEKEDEESLNGKRKMRGQAWFQLPSINSNLFVLKTAILKKDYGLYMIYFGIWSCGFPKKMKLTKRARIPVLIL